MVFYSVHTLCLLRVFYSITPGPDCHRTNLIIVYMTIQKHDGPSRTFLSILKTYLLFILENKCILKCLLQMELAWPK